jgi:hypothetical protein
MAKAIDQRNQSMKISISAKTGDSAKLKGGGRDEMSGGGEGVMQ